MKLFRNYFKKETENSSVVTTNQSDEPIADESEYTFDVVGE
jgi:hypothetical protein